MVNRSKSFCLCVLVMKSFRTFLAGRPEAEAPGSPLCAFAPLRENFFPRTALLLAFLLLATICPPAIAAENGEGNDMTAVKEYLATQYRGKTWEQGPTRLRNGAIDRAYPDWRFYYVFSSQQPAPRVGWISAVMRIGREGRVTEISGAGAANEGLMKIRGGPDAKIAAAAVMSLSFGPSGPVLVSADDVQVAPQYGGWYCLATPGAAGRRKANALEVVFDSDGRCTSVSHRYVSGP